MGLLRDLRAAGITAQDIIAACNALKGKPTAVMPTLPVMGDVPPALRGWVFPVLVETDGGSDGNASTAPTYTYTVRTLDGSLLGEDVEVSGPRDIGSFDAGSEYGLAFYDGSTLILWDAGETENVEECS